MAQDLNIYAKYVAAGSSSNQIYQDCLMAGSSSQDATETAYPTNTNPTNTGYTYKSSATKQRQVGLYVQYPFPSGSATSSANLFSNGVLVSSSKQAEEVKYGTSVDLHMRGQRKKATIAADLTLYGVLTSSIQSYLNIGASDGVVTGSSISPKFNTIQASKFTTTYSNGTVLVIGDDSKIVDVNLSNGMGIVGQQQNNRGWVKFGTNGPLWGHNGNQATLPAPGDGLYAVTGSLMVSSSKLMFYNGDAAGTNGWVAIK